MLDIGGAVGFFEGGVWSEADVLAGRKGKEKNRGSIDALFRSWYLARIGNRGIKSAVVALSSNSALLAVQLREL